MTDTRRVFYWAFVTVVAVAWIGAFAVAATTPNWAAAIWLGVEYIGTMTTILVVLVALLVFARRTGANHE